MNKKQLYHLLKPDKLQIECGIIHYIPKFKNIKRSHIDGKKYMVQLNDDHIIHFGHFNKKHYYDKIGFYKHLNHCDSGRRLIYLSKAHNNCNHNNLSINDYFSPNFWTVRLLY